MTRRHLQAATKICGFWFLAASPPCFAMAQAHAEVEPVHRSPAVAAHVDEELIFVLQNEARRLLSVHLEERGVLRSVNVAVSIETGKSTLIADFGPGFLPGPDEGYAEMFLHTLANTFRHYAEQAGVVVHDVDFLFQGKPLEYYFPGDLAVPSPARANIQNQTALVSSSHGLVRVFPSRSWEYQRPLAFGFFEDMITPSYGDALQALLETRGGLAVSRARNRSLEAHPESDRPWEQMSSRYHLKALLPDRTDLWNELANSTARDREVTEDIRSRPNFANHLGVGGMISLHTNGHPLATVRGLEVYYHGDKPTDRPLAASVLCYMRELIRAQPGYESFPIRDQPNAGRHGENRIGTMPSVLVEIAYHSNADDSAALQDPVFRSASMKGVEKGHRLFTAQQPCQPLAIERVADVEVPADSRGNVEVSFKGFPQFPVRILTRNVHCPAGWTCRDGNVVVEEKMESPLVTTLGCWGGLAGILKWETQLVDDDGVKSEWSAHQQECLPGLRGGGAGGGADPRWPATHAGGGTEA